MPSRGAAERLTGVVPAIYTPFNDNLSIDAGSLQRLADRMASIDGVAGVFCTGHAGEVASLSREERAHVVKLVAEAVNGRKPVLAGIYSDSLDESILHARDAKEAGAQIATIFPPNVFIGGATATSEAPFRWFEAIAKGAEIDLCIFQFPVASGVGYSTETLVRLATLPQVVAVKEGSGSPRAYEANLEALHSNAPGVSVLTSNNEWWLADLAYGGDGILSGSSPVMPTLQIELWRAMRDGDLAKAREVQKRIRPLLQVFYKSPGIDMHNRMKAALMIMGFLPGAAVRAPLQALQKQELADIEAALQAAGLL
nr:dihydrodipicolinate synthase family protein [Mesorhizobium sp.]